MKLSKLQQKIVETNEDKVVVISAAASGKTAVITNRIIYLLEHGADPSKIVMITFTNMAAEEMRKRIGEKSNGVFIGTIHSYANYLLLSYGIDTSKLIETEKFEKFFPLIKKNINCIKPIDYLLLDEAQDSTAEQFEFMLDMINPKSFFLVGDTRQCQPGGTKILLRDGIEKNIEDILPGDDIVYYNRTQGRCCSLNGKAYNAIHKKVEEISSREFINDELITITTETGKQSSYTPNHRTFIKLNKILNKHAVYLMCDENYRFRVGKIPLLYTGKQHNGSGVNPWRTKMKDEGCSKIWLLGIFDTDKEARVEENRISYFYQIPQICWQTNKVQWTTEDIDYIYKDIPIKNNAMRCLKDYHRDIRYPLLDLSVDWSAKGHYTTNSTVEIYASNIMPNYMSCLVFDNSNNSNKVYENIIEVKREYITKPIKVYSLKTENETYVADGIVTHNSIYGFNKACPQYLIKLTKDPNVKTYSLNENYRNAPAILNFAKGIINKISNDDSIPMRKDYQGLVRQANFSITQIIDILKKQTRYDNWFFLCRWNKQIDEVCMYLEKNNIPYTTFKKSQLTKNELDERMKENSIKVLTIHTAKGLEADNVIVYGSQWKTAEEIRVNYVAATRAKNLLIWMNKINRINKMESWE